MYIVTAREMCIKGKMQIQKSGTGPAAYSAHHQSRGRVCGHAQRPGLRCVFETGWHVLTLSA
eukprot:1138875-Pelagomonas_calceolata.AAC.9